MSLSISSTSISYNETTLITVSNLTNVTVSPSEYVIVIEYTSNNLVIATVKPPSSTIFYVTGIDTTFALISLNETVYVNTTILTPTVKTQFNNNITLNAFGSTTYLWYPSTYLNQNYGNSVICIPLKSIQYTVQGTDIFNCITTSTINVDVNSNLEFVPSNPIVYEGNLLNITVSYLGDLSINASNQTSVDITNQTIVDELNSTIDTDLDQYISNYMNKFNTIDVNNYDINEIDDVLNNFINNINNVDSNSDSVNSTTSSNLIYTWNTTKVDYLPYSCKNIIYGQSLQLHPVENTEYIVNVIQDNSLITSGNTLITAGNIKINVVKKPMNFIDIDIIPYQIYHLVITRNKKQLLQVLVKDKILSNKIINFYYNTLQTAYRMEWTNKNGIPFKVKWTTVYQIVNEATEMVMSFEQQWKFFQYINSHQTRNGNTISNFAFLLNAVNQIYLEHPQKVYYIQQ